MSSLPGLRCHIEFQFNVNSRVCSVDSKRGRVQIPVIPSHRLIPSAPIHVQITRAFHRRSLCIFHNPRHTLFLFDADTLWNTQTVTIPFRQNQIRNGHRSASSAPIMISLEMNEEQKLEDVPNFVIFQILVVWIV